MKAHITVCSLSVAVNINVSYSNNITNINNTSNNTSNNTITNSPHAKNVVSLYEKREDEESKKRARMLFLDNWISDNPLHLEPTLSTLAYYNKYKAVAEQTLMRPIANPSIFCKHVEARGYYRIKKNGVTFWKI